MARGMHAALEFHYACLVSYEIELHSQLLPARVQRMRWLRRCRFVRCQHSIARLAARRSRLACPAARQTLPKLQKQRKQPRLVLALAFATRSGRLTRALDADLNHAVTVACTCATVVYPRDRFLGSMARVEMTRLAYVLRQQTEAATRGEAEISAAFK